MLIKQITINNTYIIKFYKKKLILDNTKYIYTCIIYNNLNIKLFSINFNDIDIFNILDIYEEYLNSDIEIIYPISNCNNINYIIEFSYTDIDVFLLNNNYNDYYCKELLNIYSCIENNTIKLLSIDISNYIDSLLNLLFELYSYNSNL